MIVPGIPGVGDVTVSPEYTYKENKEKYERLMNDIKTVFDKDPSVWTDQDYLTVKNAMDGLAAMAKTPYALTSTMAHNLKQVFDVLESAGLKAGQDLNPADGLALMKILQEYRAPGAKPGETVGFSTIIGIILGEVKDEDLTLQSMLYARFLKEGAAYFAGQLEKLNKALEANEAILNSSKRLKDCATERHNRPPMSRCPNQHLRCH